MNNILIKKLNEILNLKTVKCANCKELIQFLDDPNEEYGVSNFNYFKCKCGTQKEDIDNIAYVTSNRGEQVELLDYLKHYNILNTREECIDTMYETLDRIDRELQDRHRGAVDVNSSELNLKDAIDKVEKKTIIKKLNELLNLKTVKCANCKELIQFLDDPNEEYGVLNFNYFKCKCGTQKEDIDNIAYVTSNRGEQAELLDYLKYYNILNIREECIDTIHRTLDRIDRELQDRHRGAVDIDKVEKMTMTLLKEEGITLDEINRCITVCEEVDPFRHMDMLDRITEGEDNCEEISLDGININGFSFIAIINTDQNLLLIVENTTTDGIVYDIKKLHRITHPDTNPMNIIIKNAVILLLATNFLRKLNTIPEKVYCAPGFDMNTLIDKIHKQIVTKDIVVYGQDTDVDDWTIDSKATDEFSFVNSRGSKIEFTAKEDSGNFIHLATKAITVGNEARTSYSSHLVDKLSCNILRHKKYDDVIHTFFFMDTANKMIEIFDNAYKIDDSYYSRYAVMASEIEAKLEEIYKTLEEELTKEEIEEIKSMKPFNREEGLIKMKKEYADKEEYKEICRMVDLDTAFNMLCMVQDYANYFDSESYMLDMLTRDTSIFESFSKDLKNRRNKLIEKYSKPVLIDMIKESYDSKDVRCIIGDEYLQD